MQLDTSQVAFFVSIIVINLGSIFAAYVSIIVRLTKLEVKADGLKEDVDNGWKRIRQNENIKKEE